MARMRVLVVEDEVKMASLLRRGLCEEGYAVDVAESGDEALWMAAAVEYDTIVLDVMLPGIDGFEVCRELRESGVWTPILMLTARDGVQDRVAGLDSGADDYLTKPFSFAELLARMRALTRRGLAERPTVLEVGSLRLDPATRQVWRNDVPVPLSAKEFALLETFMRRPGQVLSRYQLLEHAWDYGYENRSNVVDVRPPPRERPDSAQRGERGRPPRAARQRRGVSIGLPRACVRALSSGGHGADLRWCRPRPRHRRCRRSRPRRRSARAQPWRRGRGSRN
jgi:two-component system OmpR family response regulator